MNTQGLRAQQAGVRAASDGGHAAAVPASVPDMENVCSGISGVRPSVRITDDWNTLPAAGISRVRRIAA